MSSESFELGTAYLSVALSTEGLGRDIIRQSRGLSQAFANIGKSGGAAFASAFSGSSRGATKTAEKDQQALARTVQSSTTKVRAARDTEAAAARKVEIAEAKLDEVRAKGNAQASQILAAEDRVATARTRHATATEKTRLAVGGLEDAQKALKAATESAGQAATSVGARLKSAFAGNPFQGLAAAAKTVGAEATAAFARITDPLRQLGEPFKGLGGQARAAAAEVGRNLATIALPVTNALSGIADRARSVAVAAGAALSDRLSAAGQAISVRLDPFREMASKARARAAEAAAAFSDAVGSRVRAIGARIDPFVQAVGRARTRAVEAATVFGQGVVTRARALIAPFAPFAPVVAKAASAAVEAGKALGSGIVGRARQAFSGLAGLLGRDGTNAGKQFTDAVAQEASAGGERSGSLFRATFLSGLAVNAITGIAKKAAGAFTGAFSRGFDRLTAIDDATAKLGGLGHSAENVEKIMGDALASVKGTAFGLGDAATMAATAVAAGVEPGRELQKYLTLTGDAATIAGVSMNEMGSIFGKVQTGQRAYTSELNQLADRGIPIYQWLQEELGVSASALRDMVSAGEVDSATFFRVINDNIGGAALKAGQTFRGSLANMQAAWGRLGAAFLEPAFQRLPEVFGSITDGIDKFAPVATRAGEAVGSAFGRIVDGIGGLGGTLRPILDGLSDAAAGFIDGFGGMDAVAQSFGQVLPLLTGPLGLLKSALGEVFGGGQADMRAFGKTVGEVLGPLVQAFGQLAEVIAGALGQALVSLLPVVMEVGRVLAGPLSDALGKLAPVIGDLATALLPGLANLFATLVPIIAQVAAAILPLVTMLVSQLAPVFVELVRVLLPPLSLLLGAVASVLGTLVAALDPVITALVSQLAPILVTLVRALLPPLARVIATVAEVISTVLAPVLEVIINVLGVLFVGAINALMPVVQVVFAFIARTIGNTMDIISGIIRLVMAVIRGDWSGAWEAIKQIGSAIWDQIKNIVQTAIGLVLSIIRGILKVIQTVWDAAWEVIKAVARAAWDWITRGIELFGDGAQRIFRSIVDGIGRIWDGLKAVAAAPVRFVIETVINKGIIKGWNDLVGLLKLPDTLKVKPLTVPSFASTSGGGGGAPTTGRGTVPLWDGGILPGPGTGYGDDMVVIDRRGVPVATVASGEMVIPREQSKKHQELLNNIITGKNLPGFFRGGVLPTPGPVRPHRMPYYNAQYAADMGYGTGSPVYAWKSGRVAQVMYANTSYGNRIRVNHDPGQSLYAHLSAINVAVGQMVRAGELIGRIGYSGNVRPRGPGGAHLHFEILGGAHMGSAGNEESGGGGFLSAALGWVTDRLAAPVRKLIESIPGGGAFAEAAKGMGTKLLDSAVEKIKGLIPAGTDDGVAVPFQDGRAGTVPGLSGVTTNTYAKAANIYQAALNAGHRVSSVGGYRGDGEHVTRRAVDFMVPNKSAGDFIANYTWGNRSRFGVSNVIWWQRIITAARASEGWRAMADRGSYTQNHMDHPHVLFDSRDMPLGGYAGGTTWAAPGWHLVGEEGPELVRFRGGETVLDYDDTKAALGGGLNVTYAPVLVNEDPARQYEDFAFRLIADLGRFRG